MNLFKAVASLFKSNAGNKQGPRNLVKVDGNFRGKLKNGQQVFISSTGTLKGKIDAKSLEIHGKVNGDVKVENLLIGSTGRLHYHDLVYNQLLVEDGAIMLGERDDKTGMRKTGRNL